MLAFPLHMAVMADGSFPFGAVGLVHLENEIVQHRRIEIGEELSLRVRPTQLRPHARGKTFALLTEARVGDELVWESTSTMLRRGSEPGERPVAKGEPREPEADDFGRPAPSGPSAATSGAATRPSPATATRSTCTR